MNRAELALERLATKFTKEARSRRVRSKRLMDGATILIVLHSVFNPLHCIGTFERDVVSN
jgi:hypothetical protein